MMTTCLTLPNRRWLSPGWPDECENYRQSVAQYDLVKMNMHNLNYG
jgi:hypothetical protein